jgi:hypothetical protein
VTYGRPHSVRTERPRGQLPFLPESLRNEPLARLVLPLPSKPRALVKAGGR